MDNDGKSDFDLKEISKQAQPFLKGMEQLVRDFRSKLEAAGLSEDEAYYFVGQYMGNFVGAIGALQMEAEAYAAGNLSLSADQVLDTLAAVVSRTGITARIGFLNILHKQFGLDLKVLGSAAQERIKNMPTVMLKNPAKDPKDYN